MGMGTTYAIFVEIIIVIAFILSIATGDDQEKVTTDLIESIPFDQLQTGYLSTLNKKISCENSIDYPEDKIVKVDNVTCQVENNNGKSKVTKYLSR